MGYTGAPTDPSGLVYLNARFYNPAIGSFQTHDPLEGVPSDPASFNGYAYAGSNPVTYADPSGKCFDPISFFFCAVIAATVAGFATNSAVQVANIASQHASLSYFDWGQALGSGVKGAEIGGAIGGVVSGGLEIGGAIAGAANIVGSVGISGAIQLSVPALLEGSTEASAGAVLASEEEPAIANEVSALPSAFNTLSSEEQALMRWDNEGGDQAASGYNQPQPTRKTIVELGAGNYQNAIAMKLANPDADVYATNLRTDYLQGEEFVNLYRKVGVVIPNNFFNDLYLGSELAQQNGVIIGNGEQIFQNQDLVDQGMKADLIYAIMPYPTVAESTGYVASQLANNNPGAEVGVTSSFYESFIKGFKSGWSGPEPIFEQIDGFPYGLPGEEWESNPTTWRFIVPK